METASKGAVDWRVLSRSGMGKRERREKGVGGVKSCNKNHSSGKKLAGVFSCPGLFEMEWNGMKTCNYVFC